MFHAYYPGASFPSVSVTGATCSLHCKHCNARYLEGMRPAETPEKLIDFALNLEKSGGEGFLLSGGSDGSGVVPLGRYTGAIKRIKEETELIINAHIGFAEREDIEGLVSAGIDVFSVDVVGNNSTVKRVYGLDRTTTDYVSLLNNLEEFGAIVAPHITAGLDFGEIKGEYKAVDMVSGYNLHTLVFLSLIPTRGTAMEQVPPLPEKDFLSLLKYGTERFDGEVLVGCMRPRHRKEWEVRAVESGIKGMVIPAASTLTFLWDKGMEVKVHNHCCALRALGL